jgi:hypothetical protein
MVCSLFFVVNYLFLTGWTHPTSYDPCGSPRNSGARLSPVICWLGPQWWCGMWLKQCHKRTIPQENHHEFIGGMFTYHSQEGKWVVKMTLLYPHYSGWSPYISHWKNQGELTCFTYLGSVGWGSPSIDGPFLLSRWFTKLRNADFQ